MKMNVLFFSLLFLSTSISAKNFSPKKYVMVSFFGMGAYQSQNMDLINDIPAELEEGGVDYLYYASHFLAKKKFKDALKELDCENGIQKNKNLGMIIMGMSWGARNSYEFSKYYLKACGRKADRVYMLDGVQKLFTQFRHAPIGEVCKNYYKTPGMINGRSLENCENFDLTEIACKDEDTGRPTQGFRCHGQTLREGHRLSVLDIQENANN